MTFHASLDVAGRRVVCADGRADALPALSALLAAGALVDVVSPTAATSIVDLAQRGLLRHLSGNYGPPISTGRRSSCAASSRRTYAGSPSSTASR